MSAEERTVRRALDGIVLETIRVAALPIALLLYGFAIADLFTAPPDVALRIAWADTVNASCFVAAHFMRKRGIITPQRANLAALTLAGITALDTIHDMWILGAPAETTYLLLTIVGAGSFFLSVVSLAVFLTSITLAWILVAATEPTQDWTVFGLALAAAVVLAFVIHTVRFQALGRLERLRYREARQREELSAREAALQTAVDALEESEERYRRLVEDAPDAFLVHADGVVVYVNRAAVNLFGASSASDLLGMDSMSLVHPDQRQAVRERNRQIEQDGVATHPMEMNILRLDGRTVDVEALGHPVSFMGKAADQTIIRTITDRKRAEHERLVAGQRLAEIGRLQEMDRIKTQFVNAISHELRTPLTPIKVQLHLMDRPGMTSEKYQKSASVLKRNFDRLASIVDELLAVASIQAGTFRVAKTYIDVAEVIDGTMESYADVARSAGVTLKKDVRGDLAALGDSKRLAQVMDNLLGNAFKFTPKGGCITITARRAGAEVEVGIKDTGPGLAADDIARLFEPFSQVHDLSMKTESGTGLGLFICKGIIESHDGRIWCESEGLGHGTAFKFTVPVSRAVEDDAPVHGAGAKPSPAPQS